MLLLVLLVSLLLPAVLLPADSIVAGAVDCMLFKRASRPPAKPGGI
jgi:hypothetical protein